MFVRFCRKRILTSIILFMLAVWTGFSQESFQAMATVEFVEQLQQDGKTWQQYLVGGKLRLLATEKLSDEQIERINPALGTILTWQVVVVKELRLEFGEDLVSFIIIPESVSWNGTDYAAALPTGLRLVQDGTLMYDFRARTAQYLIRVRGILMREQELLSELELAVTQPSRYLAERDPGWAARELEAFRAETANQLQALEADLKDSEQESAAQALELEALRSALAARMNRGLFGLYKELDAGVVKAVAEYRTANPSADKTAILAEVKRLGLKAGSKEIDIILLVWPKLTE